MTAHLSLAYALARKADGKQAARLSEAVSEVAGSAAWLHADRDALKALDDAQRYAEASIGGEPVWPWVFQFDAAAVARYKAIAASRLGLAKMATDAFDQADGAARSPKQAAIVATEHARTVAAGGQLDQACALALAAYDIGCRYESERVCHAVRDFRASLGTRAPQRITAELDDRLHSAYTNRAT